MFDFLKKKKPRDPDDFTPPPGLGLQEQEKFFRRLLNDPDSNYFKEYLRPPASVMSDEEWNKHCEEAYAEMKRERSFWFWFRIRWGILLTALVIAIAFRLFY